MLPFLPPRYKVGFSPMTTPDPRRGIETPQQIFEDCGISDPRKVVHSLRHRAQDRLRAAGCPQDVREQLLGHEQMTVGEGYGVGHPVPLPEVDRQDRMLGRRAEPATA